MKSIFLFFSCLGIIAIPLAGSFAQTQSQIFICDSVSPSSPGELIIAAYRLESCLEDLSDIDSAKKLVQILNLDVVKYFQLRDLYDTEAKLEEYKKSKAYQNNLAQLTSIKNEKLKNYYYSELTTDLGKFRWDIKGFKFSMAELSTPGGLIGAPPPPGTILYNIDISSLPFKTSNETDQDISLSVDPEKGMMIDKYRDSAVTIVFFKLDKVVSKEYTYLNKQCHCRRNAKEDVITTKDDRVIIFNIRSGEIYCDEIFDKPTLR